MAEDTPKKKRFKLRKRKDNPEARMSLGAHLREARNRLIIAALGVLVGTIVAWIFYDQAFAVLTNPLEVARAHGHNVTVNFGTVLSSFDIKLRVSMWAGFVGSAPLWIYQFWAFVAPGLLPKEKLLALGYGLAGLALFVCGCLLGIWLIPHAVDVLTGFIPTSSTGYMDASQYLSFVTRLLLVFGLAFLFPEMMVGLNHLGLMEGKTMLRGWRIAVVFVFIFMAIANPLPDPWSMIFMALPICALYFGACGIAIVRDKRRAKRMAEEDAALDAALATPSAAQIGPANS